MASEVEKEVAMAALARYREYGEKLEVIFRVDVFPPSKSGQSTELPSKNRKVSKRFLALSSGRLLLIKKGTMPMHTRKVTKNIHLYDLHEIKAQDENSVRLPSSRSLFV